MAPVGEKGKNIILKSGKIHISKEAFRNMITHVLRFGNENFIEEERGVMGFCFGKINPEGKNINLITALPIIHGTKVEIGLSKENFALMGFKNVIDKYTTQDLHLIGWYHSHPGWGLFLSESDIKNHHFYQNDQNPYSFAIVFDHTLVGKDGNFGFEIYRLNNYSEMMSKDYHKLEYELEIPNTLDFFKWIQKFIEDANKKAPILIKELSEIKEAVPEDLQEIPKIKELKKEIKNKDEFFDTTSIISGIQEGSSKFLEKIKPLLGEQLEHWANDIYKDSLNGTELISTSITQMKDKLTLGMDKMEKWFKLNLDQILNKFKTKINDYIEIRMVHQKQVTDQILNLKEEMTNSCKITLETNINNIIKDLENQILILSGKIDSLDQNGISMERLINEYSDKFSKFSEETNQISSNILSSIKSNISPLGANFNAEIDKFNKELNSIKEIFDKAENTFKKLQNVVNNLKEL
jgi:proteasome lid subunit RPN8/RPN11